MHWPRLKYAKLNCVTLDLCEYSLDNDLDVSLKYSEGEMKL